MFTALLNDTNHFGEALFNAQVALLGSNSKTKIELLVQFHHVVGGQNAINNVVKLYSYHLKPYLKK